MLKLVVLGICLLTPDKALLWGLSNCDWQVRDLSTALLTTSVNNGFKFDFVKNNLNNKDLEIRWRVKQSSINMNKNLFNKYWNNLEKLPNIYNLPRTNTSYVLPIYDCADDRLEIIYYWNAVAAAKDNGIWDMTTYQRAFKLILLNAIENGVSFDEVIDLINNMDL